MIGDDECWNNTGIGWADIVSIPMTNAEGEQLPADKTSTGEKVTVTVEVSAARAGLPILWETGVLAAGLVAMGMGMTGLF